MMCEDNQRAQSMRQQKIRPCVHIAFAAFLCAFIAPAAYSGQPQVQPDNEMSGAANYDEVVRDLIKNLDKDNTTAQDAAQKLARLGRRSVPVLAEVLSANFIVPPEKDKDKEKEEAPKPLAKKEVNPRLAYYSAW